MIRIIFFYLIALIITYSNQIICCQQDDDPPSYLELPGYRSQDSSPESESFFETPVARSANSGEEYKNFWEWKRACDFKKIQPPVTLPLIKSEIEKFTAHFKKSTIIDHSYWVRGVDADATMPGIKFLLTNTFEPYVVKLEVNPDEKTIFIGDIHGDIDTFNLFLESLSAQKITDQNDPFKIIDPKAHIIFLGDYSDRGDWGVEVLYALSRFIRVNSVPGKIQKVFGLRGNHEDITINSTMQGKNLGMELRGKFGNQITSLLDSIESFYNCLPLALFLKSGSHALLACHGGVDPGFRDTKTLLSSSGKLKYILINGLHRKEMLEKLPPEFHPAFSQLKKCTEFKDLDPCRFEPTRLFHFGFLWTDYEFITPTATTYPIEYVPGRGMRFPEHITKAWFELNSTDDCTLFGNIRGHQHSHDTMARVLNRDGKSEPEESGVAKIWVPEGQKQPLHKLWPGIVCTLCVCPHGGYGESNGFNYGVFCTLTTGKTVDDWKLEVHRLVERL